MVCRPSYVCLKHLPDISSEHIQTLFEYVTEILKNSDRWVRLRTQKEHYENQLTALYGEMLRRLESSERDQAGDERTKG